MKPQLTTDDGRTWTYGEVSALQLRLSKLRAAAEATKQLTWYATLNDAIRVLDQFKRENLSRET